LDENGRRSIVAHYLLNLAEADASELLRVGMCGVGADERHRDALAAGDHVLVYLAAPERRLVGCAELGSAVHDWTPSEAEAYSGNAQGGVVLTQLVEWDPPVPMSAVLARIDRSAGARADFDAGVVRITEVEYHTALAVAAARS
jgi:hypothetical protein